MDEIRENAAEKGKIGTTRRGIGPCYEDKVGGRSIRVMDLMSESNLDSRLEMFYCTIMQLEKDLRKNLQEGCTERKIIKNCTRYFEICKACMVEIRPI